MNAVNPDTLNDPDPELTYTLFYFAARNVLIDASSIFRKRVLFGTDIATQAEAARDALEAEKKLALMDMQHEVFLNRHGPIVNPPSRKAVEQAIKLAKDVSEVLNKEKKGVDVLNAVREVAGAVAKFHAAGEPKTT